MTESNLGGRPTTYNTKTVGEILARIRIGETIRHICLAEGMPSQATFYRWLTEHIEFQEQYARAKDDQADYFAEEILDIIDDSRNDWIERENHRTGEKYVSLNEEHIARSKARVEARKWLMGKMKPKKYGDKLQLNGDKENPVSIQFIDTIAHVSEADTD